MAGGRLTGRRVVVTRPRERAGPLVAALEAEGVDVILFPAIELAPPTDPAPLEAAAARLRDYDWVVFTSAYGVRGLADALVRQGVRLADGAPHAACVGESTAAAAREAGWTAAVRPHQATGAALARALLQCGVGAGSRILFPRAADAREELPRLLREAGAAVDEVEAYRKTGPTEGDELLRQHITAGNIDVLTFTSPSTVNNFMALFGPEARGIPAVVIGPTTAAAAEAAGLRVAGVATESTTRGLVEAVFNVLNA